jgi:hypothetical protein
MPSKAGAVAAAVAAANRTRSQTSSLPTAAAPPNRQAVKEEPGENNAVPATSTASTVGVAHRRQNEDKAPTSLPQSLPIVNAAPITANNSEATTSAPVIKSPTPAARDIVSAATPPLLDPSCRHLVDELAPDSNNATHNLQGGGLNLSSLVAGMMERQNTTVDESEETARWMRSELALLLEQAAALKERRILLEQCRGELFESVVDRVVHLLPPELLTGDGLHMGSSKQLEHHSLMLQHASKAQVTTGRPAPWQLYETSSPQRRDDDQTARVEASPPKSFASYYHSSSDEAVNVISGALDAQKALHRYRLSLRRLQREEASHPHHCEPSQNGADNGGGANAQTRSIRPLAEIIAHERAASHKHKLELNVLTQREALLQQQSQSLLQDMRAELQRRDDLLRKRSDLKKSEATAVGASAVAVSGVLTTTGSCGRSIAELTIPELQDRKAALLCEWERLRAAAVSRQNCSPHHKQQQRQVHEMTQNGSISSLCVDPTVLLLPYASGASPRRSPAPPQRSSTDPPPRLQDNPQASTRWVLPEQYLVRTL